MVGASTIGIIGSYLIFIALFVLLIIFLILSIIAIIKVNKALSIWIRKNDTGIQPPAPSYTLPYSAPPVQTNYNENSNQRNED